jgi:hypothetical protein
MNLIIQKKKQRNNCPFIVILFVQKLTVPPEMCLFQNFMSNQLGAVYSKSAYRWYIYTLYLLYFKISSSLPAIYVIDMLHI